MKRVIPIFLKKDLKMKFFPKKCLAFILSFIVSFSPFSLFAHAEDNETTVLNFLTKSMGMNTAAACGVIANIYFESSFNPHALGDSGTSYGICQWHNSRWDSLKSYCSDNGYDWTTLIGQLNYLNFELRNNYPLVYDYLFSVSNTSQGAYDAGYYWCYHFEVPANKASVSVTRGNYAKNTYWSKYGNPVTHTRDTKYETNFTAYLKNPNTNHYVADAYHNTTGGYVNGNDPVTIHEVYTDGCCQFTYVLDSGAYRTAYGQISWFNVQERSNILISWITTKGEEYGYQDAFPTVDTGTTQTTYYFWFALIDENTLELYNSYCPNKTYQVVVSGKYSDGENAFNDCTYYNSDVKCIGFTPKREGAITVTAILTGDVKGKTSKSIEISYNAELRASKSSISLNIAGTNTATLSFTPTGGYPGSKAVTKSVDTNIVNIDSAGWSNGIYKITLSGRKNGTTDLVVNLLEKYSGNNTVVATATVKITVTGGTCILSYDANGGTGAPGKQTGASEYTIPVTKPTRTGYKFLGWRKESGDLGVEYSPGSVIVLTEDTTLYAVWARKASAPYWGDLNNDLYVDYQDSEILMDIRTNKITPSVEQKCFADVNLDGNVNGQDSLQIMAFLKETQDGFTGESKVSYTFVPPTKTTYLKGEALNPSGMRIVVSNAENTSVSYELTQNITVSGYSSAVAGRQTLTATYRGVTFSFYVTVNDNSYIVTYNSNGGSVSPTSTSVTGGNSVTLPTPTKTYKITYNANNGTGAPSSQTVNLNCKGWATSSTATSANYNCGASYKPGGNVTLYAVWTSPVSATLSSTKPVRDGYTFLGWATSSTATSATYSAGGSINLDGSKTLYAVWEKKPTSYTLHYDANGGTGAPSNQTGVSDYTISSTIPQRTVPCVFLGWATSSNATSAIYKPGDSITLTKDTTLYAVWRTGVSRVLTSEESQTATIEFPGQEQCYKYVPTSSGEFVFESTGSLDSIVYLYDASGTQVGYNDDSGDGKNFKLTLSLDAGSTYYMKVCAYSSKTGTTTFTVQQTTMKGDLNDDKIVDAGDAVLISRYDANFETLTAGQLKVGDLNGDGVVDAGDAVIISRFDAGLITKI